MGKQGVTQMTKPRHKKLSQALRDAEFALSSAVVRGEPKEVLDRLREKRDQVAEAGKK
jgi:hypothetical protein